MVHSEWLSVREQQESNERDRKGRTRDAEQAVEGDQWLRTVYYQIKHRMICAADRFQCHVLAHSHYRGNGHWLHRDQTSNPSITSSVAISNYCKNLLNYLVSKLIVWLMKIKIVIASQI